MKKHAESIPVPTPPETPAAEVVVEPPTTALDELKAQAADNWEKFLRVSADLENYRKRALREKEELARATREQVVAALLPALDNLERAIGAAREHATPEAALLEGVEHTHKQFKRALEDFGLAEVIAHAGHPFDPEIHEAVGHVESAEHPEGAILDQLQRGYKLTDRLLRPARVVVSKGAPPATPETP